MILDISIKDNNGNLIHHYIKNIDDGIKHIPLTIEPFGIKAEFQDFLDMYLSESGKFIREKLLPSSQIYCNSKTSIVSNGEFNFYLKKKYFSKDKPTTSMDKAVVKYELYFKTLEDDTTNQWEE